MLLLFLVLLLLDGWCFLLVSLEGVGVVPVTILDQCGPISLLANLLDARPEEVNGPVSTHYHLLSIGRGSLGVTTDLIAQFLRIVEDVDVSVNLKASHPMLHALVIVRTLWNIAVSFGRFELHSLSQWNFAELVPLVCTDDLVEIKS